MEAKKMNIWLIDDDEIYIYTAQKCIEQLSYIADLKIFKNADLALEALKNESTDKPNVIFLDLHMPVMSGWQFVTEFANFNLINTKLFVVTSSIDESDMKEAKKHTVVTAYLLKPVTPHHYKDILDNLLEYKD